MPYAFEHNGRAFTPGPVLDENGKPVDVIQAFGSVDAYNDAVEAAELKHLTETKPDRVFAYFASGSESEPWTLTTWRGKPLSKRVIVWNKRRNPRQSYTSSWIWSVNVLTLWGDWYCGTALGKGIYVKLRKMKHAPR